MLKNLGHAIPRGVLKTSGYAFGFQHSPRDLANVNGWKIMLIPILILFWVINVTVYAMSSFVSLQRQCIEYGK